MKLNLVNMDGAQVGEIELSEEVFGADINPALLHQAVRIQMANKRQGTQSTLTRAEVAGGGRKPWRQKGTGNARQGSIRSPQWRHGGVVFAPKPRDYRMSFPRKMRRSALRMALSSKMRGGEIIVLDKYSLSAPKTKLMAEAMIKLGAAKKALMVLPEKNEAIIRASRNISGLKTAYAQTLNVVDILNCDAFIMDEASVRQIEEVYSE